MSRRPIVRSPDLKKLQDEGYDIDVVAGYLVVRQVPYLDEHKVVRRGSVILSLGDMADDVAVQPRDHTIFFTGEFPCHADGRHIDRMVTGEANVKISDDLVGRYQCSAKPKPNDRYDGFYHQVTSYVAILGGPAASVDPTASAITWPLIPPENEEVSVFRYVDTASSRADIVALSKKLELPKVAIVGLGGTGSYVFDLVAKTPVREIHPFDGDTMFQHNAFRSPGAASGEELSAKPMKVDYFTGIYSKMRRGIVPHPYYVTPENVEELAGFDFVFLCMEGQGKRGVVAGLERLGIPFIDVGMGVYLTKDGTLGGIIRTTTSTPAMRAHVHDKDRIGFGAKDERNEYDRNIQIADLNMFNAAQAVMRWKKLFGFYTDLQREHHSTLQLVTNEVSNEDEAA